MKNIWNWRILGLVFLLILIMGGFSAMNESFRDPLNLLDRSRHWVEMGLIAVPMTFIIATGGIDLSVGSLVALCGIIAGIFYRDWGIALGVSLIVGVLAGAALGAFNGLATGIFRVPALVVTLATMAIFRGVAMGLSQADPIRGFPDSFTDWASISALNLWGLEIPYQLFILVAIVMLGDFILRKTTLGRWAVQMGENLKAARYATVPIYRELILLYAGCGLICGLASVIYTARFATAHPAAATGLELEVIACVLIGGTRITGGYATVMGTFLGVLILGMLRFGMDMQGITQRNQIILIGALVIGAAIFNEAMSRRARQ